MSVEILNQSQHDNILEYNAADEPVEELVDEPLYCGEASIEQIIQNKISKRVRDLNNFLKGNKFVREKGDPSANLINVAEKKIYYLPEAYVEEFFNMLDDCRKEKRMIHYSERQETDILSHTGIMIDFDRYQRSKDSQLTDRHFEALTRQISRLIYEFLDLPFVDNKFTFHVFIIKKPMPVFVENHRLGNAKDVDPKGVATDATATAAAGIKATPAVGAGKVAPEPLYKDGFHILIPEIQVIKGFKRFLLNEMISRDIVKKVFSDIPHIENPEKMLDLMSAQNPVHFVGNSKVGKPAYPITHAYEVRIDNLEEDIDRKQLNVAELLSSDRNLCYELSLGFYLESFNGKPTWLRKININFKQYLETKIQVMLEKTYRGIIDEQEIKEVDKSIDILMVGNAEVAYLKKVLSILDISYAEDYNKWVKVIWALAHTSINYKPLAIWFSHRKPEAWSPTEVDKVWNAAVNGRFSRNPLTKRSLVFWAKQSSPQKFAEVCKENYFEVLARYCYENEGRIEHAMVAHILYYMLSDKFCTDFTLSDSGRPNYVWFEFVQPGQSMRKGELYKWRAEPQPDNLHLYISEQLPKIYRQLYESIKDRREKADTPELAKYWRGIEKTFRLYQSHLSNNGFQAGVINQAKFRFRLRGFAEELDSYPDIIGVGNGILKLGPKTELIKGFHEYKISKYTETDYKPFDSEDPYVKELIAAYKEVYVEPDVFNYVMHYISTWLDARDPATIMLFVSGGGQNGKTFVAKMAHHTLGLKYVKTLKPSLLVAPTERSESANSAQMELEGIRGGYFDEFRKAEAINIARFKSIVNPNYQSGRDLFVKQKNFKISANWMAISNYQFIFDSTDHGTWRRVRHYTAKTKFCSNPDPNNPFEKKDNKKLILEYPDRPEYKQANLAIMTHYYESLHRNYGGDITNVPCPTIDYETEVFRNKQDAINRFISQMVVKTPHVEATPISAVSTKYIEWYTKHIKQTCDKIDEVTDSFENSRIAGYLERRVNGLKYLLGHRVKDNPEEPLEEGEEELIARQPNLNDYQAVNAEFKDITVYRKEKNMDDIMNTPLHIQIQKQREEDTDLEKILESI